MPARAEDPAADPADDPATDHAADLALARLLADDADAISLARFGSADLVVETKPDLTPVSDADTAVEQAVRARLAAERADDAVLGEEFGSVGRGSRRWVLDPIDGTKNFVRGVPVWATLIALMDGDEVVVGVVSAPALGRRWWAVRGGGAWVSVFGAPPRRLAVSRVASVDDASVSYSSFGGDEAWGDRHRGFTGLLRQAWRTRAYGDFWSYMLVAEGAVDIAAEPELALYDMAALAPIVTEAGGRFTGLNGVDGVLNGNAVATNGLLHEAVLGALAPSS
ncbi:inositol monophosphatase family protein [uncultured Jatrophihabitans sp.]|uniref:inositol monophosphatase family protein n=1 Tax=uncultured Jatrophihabitans sp. TaxID=1610747 RepID=UPI0035CB0038